MPWTLKLSTFQEPHKQSKMQQDLNKLQMLFKTAMQHLFPVSFYAFYLSLPQTNTLNRPVWTNSLYFRQHWGCTRYYHCWTLSLMYVQQVAPRHQNPSLWKDRISYTCLTFSKIKLFRCLMSTCSVPFQALSWAACVTSVTAHGFLCS